MCHAHHGSVLRPKSSDYAPQSRLALSESPLRRTPPSSAAGWSACRYLEIHHSKFRYRSPPFTRGAPPPPHQEKNHLPRSTRRDSAGHPAVLMIKSHGRAIKPLFASNGVVRRSPRQSFFRTSSVNYNGYCYLATLRNPTALARTHVSFVKPLPGTKYTHLLSPSLLGRCSDTYDTHRKLTESRYSCRDPTARPAKPAKSAPSLYHMQRESHHLLPAKLQLRTACFEVIP